MNLDPRALKALWAAFIILAIVVLAQNTLIILSVPGDVTARVSSGDVGVCVNSPPDWLNPIDCDDAFTNVPYTCNVSAIDPDGDGMASYDGLLLAGNASHASLFDTIDTDGIMRFNATIGQQGNYTVQVRATDDAACSLSGSTEVNITILKNTNAPVLIQPIPNSSWNQDTILIPYDLDNYFVDPDAMPLAYRVEGNSQIRVTIGPTGEVTLDPEPGFCGEEIVTYVATDVTNLSTTSNDVTLSVKCVEEEDEDEQPASSSGGGGGGGGGGLRASCQEDRFCYEWSHCHYTEAVSEAGGRWDIQIEGVLGTANYTIDGDIPDDISIFYQGYQWRDCVDVNKCESRTRSYVRTCDYEPSCFDNILNQNEVDVDCGGVCGPCYSCTDGIQNGQEEGVDCGGPDCQACHTCTDGILNGEELAVDCGGPDCPACATCFDGIQNQGETGVDCGGPCRACEAREEQPAAVASTLSRALLIAVAIAMVLVVALLVLQRWVRARLAALALKYKKTNRIILLDHDAKARFINLLVGAESALGQQDPLKSQAEIAGIVRSFFNAALGVPLEARIEDVQQAMERVHVHPLLRPVLEKIFLRTQTIEFRGTAELQVSLRTFITELRAIIGMTSVFTVADLKRQRENARLIPDVPEHAPGTEQARDALLSAQTALMDGSLASAERLYLWLQDNFGKLPHQTQHELHPAIDRLYDELILADHLENSFWYRKE